MRATTVIRSTGLPQLLTRLDVKKGNGEEDSGEGQHHEILHANSFRNCDGGAVRHVQDGLSGSDRLGTGRNL